jgi:alpha-L-fucosidase
MSERKVRGSVYVFWFAIVVILALLPVIACRPIPTTAQLQREFVDLRFGGFFHFGIMTFTGAPWATPNQDISQFNPTDLDCNQWAGLMMI